jgi:MarR family 2-MHQ and catechol resistance regulon transcriptional repressor
MGTHFTGTEREIRALNSYIKLIRAGETVHTLVHQHLVDYRLSPSQFAVLEVLYHIGPLCQRDLGKKLLKSGGNMVMVVDNLEKRGFVLRVRDKSDRRFISVQLTNEARSLIESVFPVHVKTIVDVFNILSYEEQEELDRLCKKLGLQQ